MTTTTAPDWTQRFSDRMSRVRASEIRELLKLLDQPDILSFAGGIPGLSNYRDAIAFGILILILLFKPSGLLGRSTVEKV